MKPIEVILQFALAVFMIWILSQVVKALDFGLGNLFIFIAIGASILWLVKELRLI